MTTKFQMFLLAGLIAAGGSIGSGTPDAGSNGKAVPPIVGKRGGGSSGDPGPIVDPLKEETPKIIAGGRGGGGGSGPPKNKEALAGFPGKVIFVAQPGRGGGGSGPPII